MARAGTAARKIATTGTTACSVARSSVACSASSVSACSVANCRRSAGHRGQGQVLVEQDLLGGVRIPDELLGAHLAGVLEASRLSLKVRLHAPGAALRLDACVALVLGAAGVLGEFAGLLAVDLAQDGGQNNGQQDGLAPGDHGCAPGPVG